MKAFLLSFDKKLTHFKWDTVYKDCDEPVEGYC